MSEYGNIKFDKDWEEKPIKKYLSHKQQREDISKSRYNQIKHAIYESSENTDWQSWDEFVPNWRDEMTVRDAWEFLDQLRGAGLADSTVKTIMITVQSLHTELYNREIIDQKPVAYVLDNADFDDDPKHNWIERTPKEVGEFLSSIPDPQLRAGGTLFAKTGIRGGENYNIDLPFLHLDHEIFYKTIEDHAISLHEKVGDRPDSLYIPSEPTKDEKYRGEKRLLGNKRERGTVIPIDEETKQTLLDWLAVRPITESPHPLWVSPRNNSNRIGEVYFRRSLCEKFSKRTGFYNPDSNKDFSSHWFRHFFTTNMKPGMGHHDGYLDPSTVKFLRGDIEDDIMKVYTHDWGNTIKEEYCSAIYHLGIYD